MEPGVTSRHMPSEQRQPPVELYDTAYTGNAERLYQEIRGETYDLDLGQTGWMTAAEFRGFWPLLKLNPGSPVLEFGCGAGGCAAYLARMTQADVVGIDANESAIRSARQILETSSQELRLRFEQVDGREPLPFPDESFDAVFSNDAMCHIPSRLAALAEWFRVLKPNGHALFTDAMIVSGALTNEELATRSSIGQYLFLPPGENERLIAQARFELLSAADLTAGAAAISKRWRDARAQRRESLVKIEGERNFDGLQKFLTCVQTVSEERRLSRFMYLLKKRASL